MLQNIGRGGESQSRLFAANKSKSLDYRHIFSYNRPWLAVLSFAEFGNTTLSAADLADKQCGYRETLGSSPDFY